MAKPPPAFPVLAPAKTGKSAPPIPHIAVAAEPKPPEPAPSAAEPIAGSKRSLKLAVIGLAAALLLGGAFFAYQKFTETPPPPPPVAKKSLAPAATKKAPATAPGTTPSETINKAAQVPKQAVDKAQAARAANDARVGDMPNLDQPVASAPAASATPPGSPPTKSTATTQVAQGVKATVPIQASAEASPAFRSFVVNAKISGVVWGATPARAFINGQLARAGATTIDTTLGITFDSVDAEKKLLIFKDKSGATVSRRYQ